MKGTFTRISPAAFAEKIGIPEGWFVISHRWLPQTSARRHAHGRWYQIKSSHCTVFRVLRFSPNLKGAPGQPTGEIVIDWGAWLDLHDRAEDVDKEIELEFAPANWCHWPRLAVSHPDPSIRLAGYIAVVSLLLGIVSLVISLK
jgi:hypothetical protein